MAAPPVDLNKYVNHAEILQSLSLPVKEHLPTSIDCPLCKLGRLDIYQASSDGGQWYVCSSCGFAGDGIEFYQAANHLPTINDAAFELSSRRMLTHGDGKLQYETVLKYAKTHISYHKEAQELFERARENMRVPNRAALRLLQHYSIWGGYRAGVWHQQMGRFIGTMSYGELHERHIRVPLENFYQVLVCPFYDLPGRISSFLFVGWGGKMKRTSVRPRQLPRDDGLMMMNCLKPHQHDVIAIGDPIMALHMQRRAFNCAGEPVPIVAYGLGTKAAWFSVYANRVIFWEHDDPYIMHTQALRRVGSYIASRPTSSRLDNRDLAVVLDEFRSSVMSWPEAMKKYILQQEHWAAIDHVRNLEIPAPMIKQIFDVCSPAEKQRLRQVLSDVGPERFAYVGNKRIVECDDGWYAIYPDHRARVSNVILRINKTINVQDTDENRYAGIILVDGKQVEFNEAMSKVERHTIEWLREKLMASGYPAPDIDPTVSRFLVPIARKFHEPEYVQKHCRLGWHAETATFYFPNFAVREGSIREDESAITIGEHAPAAGVKTYHLTSGQWDYLLDDTVQWAAVWAGLAGFMANMLAPVVGAPPQPVGFVGLPGSIASLVADHLIEQLGIPRLSIAGSKAMIGVRAYFEKYGYPAWLEISGNRSMVSHLDAATPDMSMALLTEEETAVLTAGNSWCFVRSTDFAPQIAKLPSLKGVMNYLAWMQAKGFELDVVATSMPQAVLLSLQKWAFAELGASSDAVFKRASDMLMTYDRMSLDRRFLYLIFTLLRGRRMKSTSTPFYEDFCKGVMPSTVKSVLIDEKAEKVFISLSGLRAAIHYAHLPVPDYDGAMQEFAAAPSETGFAASAIGFALNKKYYDSERDRWSRLR